MSVFTFVLAFLLIARISFDNSCGLNYENTAVNIIYE